MLSASGLNLGPIVRLAAPGASHKLIQGSLQSWAAHLERQKWKQQNVLSSAVATEADQGSKASATNGIRDGVEPGKLLDVVGSDPRQGGSAVDHQKLLKQLGIPIDVLKKLEGSIALICVGKKEDKVQADSWSRRIRGASGGKGLIPRTRWSSRHGAK